MSPTHRPLSSWIAQVHPETGALGRVNDGDDRADARTMSVFAQGWRRYGVPLGPGPVGLGLEAEDGSIVLELDDIGRPIQITPAGLAVIDRVEQHWPAVDDDVVRAIGSLVTESLPVRYWLTERLGTEGDPPAQTFAILPWHLLDKLCESVVAGLDQRPGEPVRVGHWLAPAVYGLAGPLECFNDRLRTGDPAATRQDATKVLTALRTLPLARVPRDSRMALRQVGRSIGRVDPRLSDLSTQVDVRLTHDPVSPTWRIRLNTTFEAAASNTSRERVHVLGDDLQRVRLTEISGGLFWVRVRVSGFILDLAARNPVFALWVIDRDDRAIDRFWVALTRDGGDWTGLIRLQLPEVCQIDVAGPPIAADRLTDVSPATLLMSLRASSRTTANRWLEIAGRLPAHHPVRVAVDLFKEDADQQ